MYTYNKNVIRLFNEIGHNKFNSNYVDVLMDFQDLLVNLRQINRRINGKRFKPDNLRRYYKKYNHDKIMVLIGVYNLYNRIFF